MKTTLITKMIIICIMMIAGLMFGLSSATAQCPPCLQLTSCECSVDMCATSESDGAVSTTAVFHSCDYATRAVSGTIEVNGVSVEEFSTSLEPESDYQVFVSSTGQPGVYETVITATSTNVVGPTVVVCETDCAIPHCAIDVLIDIRPMGCPNPLNVRSNGLLPVAIVGMAGFDVSTVDPASILLDGGAGLSPLRWSWEDVATPTEDGYDCNDYGGDGITDLVVMFDIQGLVAELGEVSDGDVLPLSLTANLIDGTPIIGEDLIVILKRGM